MKTEYFTFGTGQVHSIAGKTFDKDTIIKITAENPRQKMFDYFGADWAFNYDNYEDLQLQKFWKNYEIYDLLKKEVVETNKYKIIQIKFKGIDDWNRPVYKVVDKNIYFGSTEKLFSHNDEKNKIDKFFKENIKLLEYFGRSFNCEPMGGIGKNKLEIVD